MIVTVQYTQVNETTCIRETYHDEECVSLETLDQVDIPLEVQRLMMMKVIRPLSDNIEAHKELMSDWAARQDEYQAKSRLNREKTND